MKKLTVLVPDAVYMAAERLASKQGVDVGSFYTSVLTENFLDELLISEKEVSHKNEASNTAHFTKTSDPIFIVQEHFPGYPQKSIDLAQRFVDASLEYSDVVAFKKKRGIGFEPNFVYVEYLRKRSNKSGITVSFYGPPEEHSSKVKLTRGQGNYTRAHIRSEDDLQEIFPLIQEAYKMKFGR